MTVDLTSVTINPHGSILSEEGSPIMHPLWPPSEYPRIGVACTKYGVSVYITHRTCILQSKVDQHSKGAPSANIVGMPKVGSSTSVVFVLSRAAGNRLTISLVAGPSTPFDLVAVEKVWILGTAMALAQNYSRTPQNCLSLHCYL